MALSTRDVVDEVARMVREGNSENFADMFGENAVMRFPFAAPGMPSELRGREGVRAFYAASAAEGRRSMIDVAGVDTTIRQTDDPEVVVAEIEHHGHSRAIDGPYRFRAVAVIRVRDGQIVSYDDYMNPVALAQILGRTKELVAALTDA
jgi:ketosteroid isomerase-like protein